MLPIALERGTITRSELGLVDSGADTSILPFDVGLLFGLDWNSQPILPSLGGILSGVPARGVILSGSVGSFHPVRLAFAWVRKNDIPLILGQANFFMEFDIAFYRHRSFFRIEPRTP
jgi:hypothetical protein